MIYSATMFGSVLASIAMTKAALVPVSKESPLPVPLVTVFAGQGTPGLTNGIGTMAKFISPWSVAISPDLKFALVADYYAHQIRYGIRSTTEVSVIAGNKNGGGGISDGFGTSASFNGPSCVDISPDGTYALVTEFDDHRIRKLVIGTGEVSTFAGSSHGYADGVGSSAQFSFPNKVAISPNGDFALVSDSNRCAIRKIDISTRTVTTLAGLPHYRDFRVNIVDGVGTNALFSYPTGIAISPNSKFALVADYDNIAIRKIDISTQEVSTVAGSGSGGYVNGYGANVKFNALYDLDISPDGSYALIADTGNCAIRKLNTGTGEVTSFAGHCGSLIDGAGTNAVFHYPTSVAISPSGRSALVTDYYNSGGNVRKIQILPPPKQPIPKRLR